MSLTNNYLNLIYTSVVLVCYNKLSFNPTLSIVVCLWLIVITLDCCGSLIDCMLNPTVSLQINLFLYYFIITFRITLVAVMMAVVMAPATAVMVENRWSGVRLCGMMRGGVRWNEMRWSQVRWYGVCRGDVMILYNDDDDNNGDFGYGRLPFVLPIVTF